MRGFIEQSTTLPTPTLTMSDAANAFVTLKAAFGEQKMSSRPSTAIEIQGFFSNINLNHKRPSKNNKNVLFIIDPHEAAVTKATKDVGRALEFVGF